MAPVRVKRVYDAVAQDDGHRVLVDRIWPRGISKVRAAVDAWMPGVAPSHELRKWFNHEPERWVEFQDRYRSELDGSADVEELIERAAAAPLTLVYSARDREHNQAVALAVILDDR